MKKVVIVRGLPGSGKSTIAQKYKDTFYDSCFICSTDDYWMRPDGLYDFNYALLNKSHQWNQQRVEHILREEQNTLFDAVIIIDNTNTTFNEMRPYVKLAVKYGYEIEVQEPTTWWKRDVEECFERNTHGVPYSTVRKMDERWEDHDVVMEKIDKFVEKESQ
jgi:predicted kinase